MIVLRKKSPVRGWTYDLSRYTAVSTPMIALILASFISGCASMSIGGITRRGSDQVIKADPKTADPLTSLEQELTKVHSERVIVSTALLKSLVKNERVQQNQCKNISGQLEAIKNIDLEEAEEPRK